LETDRFPEGLDQHLNDRTAAASTAFTNSLNDDLNTAEALGAIFEYVRDINSVMDSGEFRSGNTAAALAFLAQFDSVFDVLKATEQTGQISDDDVQARIDQRNAAKK